MTDAEQNLEDMIFWGDLSYIIKYLATPDNTVDKNKMTEIYNTVYNLYEEASEDFTKTLKQINKYKRGITSWKSHDKNGEITQHTVDPNIEDIAKRWDEVEQHISIIDYVLQLNN